MPSYDGNWRSALAQVAETYLRLGLIMPEPDQEAFSEFIRANAIETAQKLYPSEVEIFVRVIDGSVRLWVKVSVGLYLAVSAYGSFRSGIDYLVKDAQLFSEEIRTVVENTGINEEDILVFQRRLGTVGKLKRAFDELRNIERASYLNRAEKSHRYLRVKALILDVLATLPDPRDREMVINELPATLRNEVQRGTKAPLKLPAALPVSVLGKPEDWEEMEIGSVTYEPAHRADIRGKEALSLPYERKVRFDAAKGTVVQATPVQQPADRIRLLRDDQ